MTVYLTMPVWKKDLARSIGISSNVMPSSPQEVKSSKIPTPPPSQSNASNFSSNGLIPKNCKTNSNGSHSPPTHLSAKTTTSPSPPNPQAIQRSLSTSNPTDSIGSSSVRQISKLKRFLTTLYQFANDISTDVGDRVRSLIIGLVNSTITTEEFHQKIQEVTNYPLRPYVIPFLKLHLPILQTDLVHYSRLSKISPAQYLREHESLILDSNSQTTALTAGEPFEIFQRNDPTKDIQTKRRPSPEMIGKENGFNDNLTDRESGPPPAKRHQPMSSPTIGSRLSPAGLAPLLLHASGHHHSHHNVNNPSILHSHLSTSARSMFDEPNTASAQTLYHNSSNRENTANGRSHSSAEHISDRYSTVSERFEREYCRPGVGLYSGLQRDYSDDRDMEDEWKSIHTMLNCILGMVEKTKRALAILQHRSDTRSTEFTSNPMWNMPTLRARHFNPLDVTHSSHEFHDMKKPRVDNIISNHFQKTAIAEIDRITDLRRTRPGTHHNLEEAVNEVKRQAVAELQKAVSAAESKATELVATERLKMEKLMTDARRQAAEEALVAISHQDDSTENCWNCGRKASETCSGCNVARYCGSFCQHKDWENHHRVCQNTSSNGSNGSVAQSCMSAEKRSKSRSPTPASNTSGSVSNKNSASASHTSAGDSRDNKIKNE